jgi:flagellar basal body-associated protein FliL
MLRRAFLVAAAGLAAPLPAFAAGAKPEDKGDAGQYVALQPVGLPIVVDRKLVNYIFVHVRINLTSAANAAKLREKEPFFRDALVRTAHRTPFTLASDLAQIDVAKLSAALKRDATAIAGAGQIRSVEVTSQAPRRRGYARPLGTPAAG